MLYLLYLPALIIFSLLYFRLAVHLNITDVPNHRSSHDRITIRGGGIIFPIALLLQFLISGFQYPAFTTGLIIIGLISFYDDLRPLSSKIRLLVHLTAVSFLFIEADLMAQPFWIIGLAFILVIGTINAYNFMDGINGITGSYSLITILSLFFINATNDPFVSPELLIVTIIALLIFNFFNFRNRAKCFAGDVGSVSIAYIILFFILLLILHTGNLKYIGFLLLYGLDSVTTILFRLFRRENIFEAHRSHFYQYLANVKGWPHLGVSTLYMIVQLIVNLLIIYSDWNSTQFLVFVIFSGVVFLTIRFLIEGKNHLLGVVKN